MVSVPSFWMITVLSGTECTFNFDEFCFDENITVKVKASVKDDKLIFYFTERSQVCPRI